MTPILYGLAALAGFKLLKKPRVASHRGGSSSRVASSRVRNCGTNTRCGCRSH